MVDQATQVLESTGKKVEDYKGMKIRLHDREPRGLTTVRCDRFFNVFHAVGHRMMLESIGARLEAILHACLGPIGEFVPHANAVLDHATAIEVGDQKLLFDARRGVPVRLSRLGIALARIDTLFTTHPDCDHVRGIPDLWLTGWLPGGGGRKQPFRVIGPTGTKELMANLEKACAVG